MASSIPQRRRVAPLTKQPRQDVYFIQDTHSKAIKIGISADVKARLASLQTSNPHPLVLLGTIEGGERQEKALHNQFAKARKNGEWFAPIPELCQFIEMYVSGEPVAQPLPVQKPVQQPASAPITRTRPLSSKPLLLSLYDSFVICATVWMLAVAAWAMWYFGTFLPSEARFSVIGLCFHMGGGGALVFLWLFILIKFRSVVAA